ncbi:site-specific integrase [Francisella salimarina]|uniref:Site-specific integrase n=1 Tax=Francisella salimarina TaxID=2599927 RepID=A0AAJ4NM24_9GAMM|nr:site-specific integrase [Francisella salimarina]QWU98530.1 site-specific integrase [Francisella salimarina]
MKINRKFLKEKKPTDKTVDYYDSEVKGLILRISKTGVRSFRLRYKLNNKTNLYTIGQLGSITLDQAKLEAQRLNLLIAQGVDIKRENKPSQESENTNLTLRQYLDTFYLNWYKTHNRNYESLRVYLGKPLQKLFDVELDVINDKKYLTKYLSDYQNENNSSNATYNRMLSTLKGMFSRAYEFGYIEKNNVRDVKLLQVSSSKIRYLDNDETKKFFDNLPKLKSISAQNIIKIAYYTGMRKGEILSLNFDDIDYQTNQITLKSSNTKSNKTRSIPIHEEVMKIIKSIERKSGLLFVSEVTGKKFDNIDRSWKQLMKLSEIENFRFHDLRHNFCSMLVMKGVPIYTVSQLAGHADVKTTQIYAHLSPDVKKSAIDLI